MPFSKIISKQGFGSQIKAGASRAPQACVGISRMQNEHPTPL